MSPALQELKLLCAAGFYLGSNFIIVFVPVVVYLAYSGSLLARCLVLLTIFDYCWPLRQPGLWLEWCKFTNDSAGKRSYFGGCECIFEGKSFSKERNYLLVYHPHALFGICYNIITEALYEDRGIIGLFTGANVLEKLPLLRRVLVWWGYTSVSANAMRQNMQRPYPHNVLTLMPGGIAEMFYGTRCGSPWSLGYPMLSCSASYENLGFARASTQASAMTSRSSSQNVRALPNSPCKLAALSCLCTRLARTRYTLASLGRARSRQRSPP